MPNSSDSLVFSETLPPPPARLFLVGIGGIGMSGLAQFLLQRGYAVGGSDRGLAEPARQELFAKLKAQGIQLFPQDGSGPRAFAPDAFIVSAAIEPGNLDLEALPDLPIIHRATALSQALAAMRCPLLTVAGSCGKTSVTGWLASALRALGHRVLMVNGGYCLDCETEMFPGNFFTDDNPVFLVAEVDESDKSIREFQPDYALLLNVGHDHYDNAELQRVFAAYLGRARCAAVAPADLSSLLPTTVPTACFSQTEAPGSAYPTDYQARPSGISFQVPGFGTVNCRQTGKHSAWNAVAILQLLRLVLPDVSGEALCQSLSYFDGIRQRFEVFPAQDGRYLVNDYAHNPEKIAAAISAARERFGSPLLLAFQPHGFRPFGFMREELRAVLKDSLQPGDRFFLLPVFYAGGSASFSPTSAEVAQDFVASGLPVTAAERDDVAQAFQEASDCRCLLVMGARDASLRTFTAQLANSKGLLP